MEFDHTLFTELAIDEVWALFDEAFVDSTVSPVWPNHLERIRSTGIREGERVHASYRAPVTGIRMKQSYILFDVQKGRRFSYRVGSRHPLVGGGTVELIEQASGTEIHWFGAYDIPNRPDAWFAAAFVKLYFEGRFFESLEIGFRQYASQRRVA